MGWSLVAVDGWEALPDNWLQLYRAAVEPFNLIFDDTVAASPVRSSLQSGDLEEDIFGENYEDFECWIAERPFGMAADGDPLRSIQFPYMESVLSGYPADLAGVKRDVVLVAVGDCPVAGQTWQLQSQLVPLPARFLFRRRRQQPTRR